MEGRSSGENQGVRGGWQTGRWGCTAREDLGHDLKGWVGLDQHMQAARGKVTEQRPVLPSYGASRTAASALQGSWRCLSWLSPLPPRDSLNWKQSRGEQGPSLPSSAAASGAGAVCCIS